MDRVAAVVLKSSQQRPSSSLRRIPVNAATQRREETVSTGGPEKRLELVGGPGVLFDLRDRPSRGAWAARRRSEGGFRVERLRKRAADHEVHLVHGLGGETGGAVGRVEQPS